MVRPVSLLPALVVLATCLTAFLAPVQSPAQAQAPAQAPRARAAEDTPLTVTIESLNPTAIPKKGPIRVSGTLTNRDDETWTSINLYAFQSAAPMTTPEELAAAAEVPPEDQVGERITDVGTYDSVDELAPGETVRYAFTVPRSDIVATEPGVYWFGVHALGSNAAGGDSFADGRARTFLPLVPPKTDKTVQTALVIPIRHHIAHSSDGSVADVQQWTRALRRGALSSLVDLGATAGSRPVTWLVDPAVIDVVRRLADGNPPRSLRPSVPEDGAVGRLSTGREDMATTLDGRRPGDVRVTSQVGRRSAGAASAPA